MNGDLTSFFSVEMENQEESSCERLTERGTMRFRKDGSVGVEIGHEMRKIGRGPAGLCPGEK
ncbi:hypothetical protein ACRALDRAFT_207691 [Sodiomyces alcalophilus JCM 7366]|uniref:uncharacterized protein n=1 Tax=Sodiomyces alcalophilus JCM 7366 TaxID=591952 RepID=UPI0039B3B535